MLSSFTSPLLARLTLAVGLALTGCMCKEEVAPAEAGCGTAATVRFCYGHTLMCPTEHTTLELADGTRLQPTGPSWEAYLPHQTDGQKVYIGYSTTGPATNGSPASLTAALTCLNTEAR